MDDVLIFGKDHGEHDDRLHTALQRIQKAGVTLNRESCLTFCRDIINERGMSLTQPRPLLSILCQSQLTGQETDMNGKSNLVNPKDCRNIPALAGTSQPKESVAVRSFAR